MWITDRISTSDYPWLTVLCLTGFSTSQPIDVAVAAGTFHAHTRVIPVSGTPVPTAIADHDDEVPRTLFEDGATLKVYSRNFGGSPIPGPAGTLVSEMWEFTPPPAALAQIAVTRSMTLMATQGARRATVLEPVHLPTTPGFRVVPADSVGSQNLMVVMGFPAGERVPVGLYRRDDSTDPATARLLLQAGSVTMPASRVVEFAVPDSLVAAQGAGRYCVMPPVTSRQPECLAVIAWPRFPGPISPGDTGPIVKQWQQILIKALLISDTPQNHDGVYGPKTVAVIRSQIEQFGNPDGDLRLGKGFYRLVTSHVAS